MSSSVYWHSSLIGWFLSEYLLSFGTDGKTKMTPTKTKEAASTTKQSQQQQRKQHRPQQTQHTNKSNPEFGDDDRRKTKSPHLSTLISIITMTTTPSSIPRSLRRSSKATTTTTTIRSSRSKLERDIFALIALISTLCYIMNMYLVSSDNNNAFDININRNLQSSSFSSSYSSTTTAGEIKEYKSSKIENYLIQNARKLGLETPNKLSKGCTVWKDDPNSTTINTELQTYRNELHDYMIRLNNFQLPEEIEGGDLRLYLSDEDHSVCDQLELHPNGLEGIFSSGSLSEFVVSSSESSSTKEYIEPLLTPLRHPEFCYFHSPQNLMRLDYIVHDFKMMCQRLKSTSKIIMIDMGASLDFHTGSSSKSNSMMYQPAVYLTQMYSKFGFKFDHIYAFEVTPKSSTEVYDKIPTELLASYHWINVGVSSDINSKLNPLKLILDNYNEDDLIVVKLDIDTTDIEMSLVYQLLENKRLNKLVDQFYFEHHVKLHELSNGWRETMRGSVGSSLRLFQSLRQNGISAHYWV